jgi:hypothetical protein
VLQNIKLHLNENEVLQDENDKKLASHIYTTHKANINAFQRNIPSLMPKVQAPSLSSYSLFINKYGETNIVNYDVGRTFYGFHPEQEVIEQLAKFQQHCPEISVTDHPPISKDSSKNSWPKTSINTLESMQVRHQQSPLPYEIECLVVLGCGLGIHLLSLLKQHKIRNLVIYEPEMQYFQCSIMATSWQDIFTLTKEQGTALFLQLEKDGRDIIDDINELIEHCSISSFHLYKHYNHPVFNSMEKDLTERSWVDITKTGFSVNSTENHLDYLPIWTTNIDLDTHSLLVKQNDIFSKNIQAFEKYFPEIYKEYKQYKPQKWLPIANAEGEVNLVKIDGLHTWYGKSPKHDCVLNFENFSEQPNKDGLELGYKGTKLAHYIHYQFVKETEALLNDAEEEEEEEKEAALPDNISSIIMFGVGVGYQLEKLVHDHTVEKLFICEPNPDFFYASLFAIDWLNIFETVEQSNSRIYLNIGDDGTDLFKDLLSQFASIGPYILNSTYFYQSYYNASLNPAIKQLREQLQVMISMGEYFDHAYYGIAHTKEAMKRKIPILNANPANKLGYENKEVPIFIVGNGPSLDTSINAIKEWQGQVIVISCGTALQALHKHGIIPDFHADIEQNRTTFDWAVLIGDLDYLKNITLISCNGIHPDTCELYKDVLIAFKEAESSTLCALEVLGRENFEVLQNAYPTVSNFVCDLFSKIGFTSIYLIAIDLGFVDVKYHHSKSSGYYQKDGQETYDYAISANTSLIVPGNFRPSVNTKYEFKVARQVIEQVIQQKPKSQSFYNCSDGARIQGTVPLRPNELLIVTTKHQKQQTVEQLKTVVFSTNNIVNYIEKFEQTYSHEILTKELKDFETFLKQEVNCTEDVNSLIKTQRKMLVASYENGNSLFYSYFYGTVNYVNAMLVKLNGPKNKTPHLNPNIAVILEHWLNTLKSIGKLVSCTEPQFDHSSFNKRKRESILNRRNACGKSFLILTSSTCFAKSIENQLRYCHWDAKLTISDIKSHTIGNNRDKTYDHVILYKNKERDDLDTKKIPTWGLLSTILVTTNRLDTDIVSMLPEKTSVISIAKDNKPLIDSKWRHDDTFVSYLCLWASLQNHEKAIILPKYIVKNDIDDLELSAAVKHNFSQFNYLYDFSNYILAFNKPADKYMLSNGTRGRLINNNLKGDEFTYTKKSISDYEKTIYALLRIFPEEINDEIFADVRLL